MQKLDYIGLPKSWLDTSFPLGLQCRGVAETRFSDWFRAFKREKGACSMKHPALRYTVAALLLSGVCSAYAADSSYWYTGLGVGLSRVQFYPADFGSGGVFSERKNEFDAGFKGFIGHKINPNWGAELSYATLGKFHYKYDNGSVTQDAVYKVTGVGFSAVPTVPFTRNFSVYGRLGAFFSQTRLTFYNSGFVVGSVGSSRQFSDTSFLSGFGHNISSTARAAYASSSRTSAGSAASAARTSRPEPAPAAPTRR